MAVAGCLSALNAARHAAKNLFHTHRPVGHHATAHAHGAPAAPSTSGTPLVCQDRDAPFRVLQHAAKPPTTSPRTGPGQTGREPDTLANTSPGQTSPGVPGSAQADSRTLAKTAAAMALATATGAGSVLGYHALAAAAPGAAGASPAAPSTWPGLSQVQQPALDYPLSFMLSAPGMGGGVTPQSSPLTLTPSALIPGTVAPTPVPEPASALVLAPSLLAFALARYFNARRTRKGGRWQRTRECISAPEIPWFAGER